MSAVSPFVRVGARERQRQETRSRLFDAALAEFASVGFDRASVADIARAAGVSRPSFYFHFPTKEHVLFELQWRQELEIVERLRRCRTLAEALRELPDALVDALESVGDAELARDTARIYARRPGELPVDEQPLPLLHEVVRLFQEGARRGELRAGLTAEQGALLFLTGVFGYVMAADPQQDRRADLRALTALYLA